MRGVTVDPAFAFLITARIARGKNLAINSDRRTDINAGSAGLISVIDARLRGPDTAPASSGEFFLRG
jgi:hypothetical protein